MVLCVTWQLFYTSKFDLKLVTRWCTALYTRKPKTSLLMAALTFNMFFKIFSCSWLQVVSEKSKRILYQVHQPSQNKLVRTFVLESTTNSKLIWKQTCSQNVTHTYLCMFQLIRHFTFYCCSKQFLEVLSESPSIFFSSDKTISQKTMCAGNISKNQKSFLVSILAIIVKSNNFIYYGRYLKLINSL